MKAKILKAMWDAAQDTELVKGAKEKVSTLVNNVKAVTETFIRDIESQNEETLKGLFKDIESQGEQTLKDLFGDLSGAKQSAPETPQKPATAQKSAVKTFKTKPAQTEVTAPAVETPAKKTTAKKPAAKNTPKK